MENLIHAILAIAAIGVPLACAYLIVRRLGRRNASYRDDGIRKNNP